MLKLEREVWRKVDTPNYFVTIHKDIPSFLNEKNSYPTLPQQRALIIRKDRKVVTNNSIIHRGAIDFGLQR